MITADTWHMIVDALVVAVLAIVGFVARRVLRTLDEVVELKSDIRVLEQRTGRLEESAGWTPGRRIAPRKEPR